MSAARPRRRLALQVALLLVGLLGPLIGWFVTGWAGVRRLQDAIDESALGAVATAEANVAGRLAAILELLREREDRRPYFHYQSLYHDPNAADLGASIVPSPLVEGPNDLLVETYFQVDPGGTLTVPTFNEEVPAMNAGPRASEGRRALDALRPTSPALVTMASEPREAAPAAAAPRSPSASVPAEPPAPSPQRSIQQVLDNRAFTQNVEANQIYNDIKGRKRTTTDAPDGEVVVTIEPLRYAIVTIEGAPRIVALRGVQTPGGRSTQGFVLSTAVLTRWIAMPANASLLALPGDEDGAGTAVGALPLVRGSLRVVVPPRDTRERAEAKAALASEFLYRFVPVSVAAMVACGLALLVVVRTERLARQRSQFAASAAHELRTPLAGLRLYAEMLEGGLGDPARAGDYARRIGEEAARLGRVVGNVLGYSQLERDAIVVRPRKADLAAWLETEVARLEPGLAALGATIRLRTDERPTEVAFDADALGQILQNLVDNAEKYARDARDRVIEVHLGVSADEVTLEVRDHGPGVPPPLRDAAFRPFVRGEAQDLPAGVGLGLSISRALARAHGGELELAPSDAGARFVLQLPRGA